MYRILAAIGFVCATFALGGLTYWLLWAIGNAPHGRQDRDGFHYTRTRRRGDK